MKFTLFSVCVLLIIITSITLHSYKGYNKGVFSTLLTFSINVCSIVFSIILLTIISTNSSKLIENLITINVVEITDIANMLGVKKVMDKLLLSYRPLLVMAGQFLFGALLSIPCFLIFKIIFSIVVKTVINKKFKKDETNLDYVGKKDSYLKSKHKTYGAIVGAISGFIVAIFILSPIIGGLQVTERAVNYAKNTILVKNTTQVQELNEEGNNGTSNEIKDALTEIEVPYVNEFATEFVYAVGGKAFFASMTNAKVLGVRTNLERELTTIENFNIREIIGLVDKLLNLKDENNVKEIKKYAKMMKSSLSFSVVSANFFSQATSSFLKQINNPNRGLTCLNSNLISPVNSKVLKICSRSDGETVRDNMLTLLNLVQILQEVDWKEVEKDYTLLLGDESSEGLISTLSKELAKNPKMKHLVEDLEGVPVSILTKEMSKKIKGIDYEVLITTLTDTVIGASSLNEEKKRSEVLFSLSENLSKHDIWLPNVLTERIASLLIIDIKKDLSKLTKKDVSDFFLKHGNVE